MMRKASEPDGAAPRPDRRGNLCVVVLHFATIFVL